MDVGNLRSSNLLAIFSFSTLVSTWNRTVSTVALFLHCRVCGCTSSQALKIAKEHPRSRHVTEPLDTPLICHGNPSAAFGVGQNRCHSRHLTSCWAKCLSQLQGSRICASSPSLLCQLTGRTRLSVDSGWGSDGICFFCDTILLSPTPSLLDAFSRRSGLLGTSCDRFYMSFLPIL